MGQEGDGRLISPVLGALIPNTAVVAGFATTADPISAFLSTNVDVCPISAK
jgi:hypothetical protein